MNHWKQILTQGAVAGSLASLLSTGVLFAAGRRQTGSGAAPINAVSHWYWGDEALRRDRTDVSHTAVGYLTHHGAAIFWATLHAAAMQRLPASRSLPGIAWGALATSAVACFADYQLTPKRFTPGFEHRLSTPALFGVYGAFGVGLALGALAMRGLGRRQPKSPRLRDGPVHNI